MTRITPPTEDDVRASVERVADRILPRLRASSLHPWRRRIIATVAGLGLFASGLGVGAAAYGATIAPRTSTDTSFGISCYTDADSSEPAVQIGMDRAELIGDPVASCDIQRDVQSAANLSDAAGMQYLVTGKAECIVISSPGSPDQYMWKSGQDATSHELTPFWVREPAANDPVAYEGSSAKPDGFPATCLPVTIPAATTPPAAYGACKVDAHHAAVFPLGTRSVQAVCRSHQFTVWTTATSGR